MSNLVPERKSRAAKSTEERAWEALYRTVGDCATALELVKHFDADPDTRRCHLALYLRCRQTIRAAHVRTVRNRRIAAIVHLVVRAVLVVPLTRLWRTYQSGTDLTIEIIAQSPTTLSKPEPAVRRVRRLAKDDEFAQAKQAFPTAPATASAHTDETMGQCSASGKAA